MVVGTQLGYFALAAPALVLSALALVRYFAAPHVPLDGQLDALVSYAGALSVLVLVPADVWSALNRPDRAAVPDSGDRKVRGGRGSEQDAHAPSHRHAVGSRDRAGIFRGECVD